MVEQSTTAEQAAPASGTQDAARKNIQSTVDFPYSDLKAVVELAEAIRANAGSSCADRELAGWLDQSVDGGTYRSRRSSAVHFGLITVSQGRLTLTPLGHDVTDGAKGQAARASAFLLPGLYSKMYGLYGGKSLPPAAAIERQMVELGVSPKQKERARQVFQKSATYAGFVDQSTGRFVKPGNSAEQRVAEPHPEKKDKRGGGGGGGGGDGEMPSHPLVIGLFQSLPPDGTLWTLEDAVAWLEAAAVNLRLAYKFKGAVTITQSRP